MSGAVTAARPGEQTGEQAGAAPAEETAAAPARLRGWKQFAIGGIVVAAVIATAVTLPVDRWLLGLVEWIREAGFVGALVFALAYVVATVFVLPGSLLTLGAGFAYGPAWGLLLVSPASVLAATCAFLLGRSVARGWIAKKVEGDERFAAIDEAIGADGMRIVLLLRLSPVFPFNILNYALGLTRVRLRDYVLASFVGMLPGTLLYVYLGSLVTSAAQLLSGERPDAGAFGQALFYGGLIATVVVTLLVTHTARRALQRALADTADAAVTANTKETTA